MAGSTSVPPGRIFISYRRQETAYPAGWLYERLAAHFGREQLFKDVDSIVPGDDFAKVIANAVGSCDVLLALIGDQWLTIPDEEGRPRLANPDDFVRLEIEAALNRDVRVIPILVDGARLPRSEELPASLAELVRRQALELSPNRFEFDSGKLLRVVETTLAERQAKRGAKEQANPAPRERAEHQAAPGIGWRFRSARQKWLLLALTLTVVLVVGGLVWANRPVAGQGPARTVASGTPTTTRTPTTTGVGQFRDDFTDTSNSWDTVDDTRHRLRYAEGTYQMLAKQPGDYYAFPRARYQQLSALHDVTVEVDARRNSGTESNGYGIVCRYQGTGDMYWFNITNDGYYGVNKKIGGKTVKLQSPVPTNAISPTALNHLQATCIQGSNGSSVELVLRVNGRRISQLTDRENPVPAGGGVGLFAHNSGDGPAGFVFDNFKVSRA